MRPEWTAAVGAGFVNFFNRLAATKGVRGVQSAMGALMGGHAYSGGGVIDWLGSAASTVGNVASDATGAVLDAGKYLTNPAKVWNDLIGKITGAVSSLGTTDWAHMLEKFPVTIAKGLRDKALSLASSIASSVVKGDTHLWTQGVIRWRPLVLQALAALGQSPDLAPITLKRMNQESGGNPLAVNLWDSNAKAGHPSVGLMQLIRGTWEEYAGNLINTGPFLYGVSVDPYANIVASMRYALSRYGSLQSAYGRAGGYDEGGWLMPGDWATYNHTGKPEPVFSPAQWETLRANVDGAKSPTLNADVTVYVGDREITDIVRTEIHVHDATTVRGLKHGRRP